MTINFIIHFLNSSSTLSAHISRLLETNFATEESVTKRIPLLSRVRSNSLRTEQPSIIDLENQAFVDCVRVILETQENQQSLPESTIREYHQLSANLFERLADLPADFQPVVRLVHHLLTTQQMLTDLASKLSTLNASDIDIVNPIKDFLSLSRTVINSSKEFELPLILLSPKKELSDRSIAELKPMQTHLDRIAALMKQSRTTNTDTYLEENSEMGDDINTIIRSINKLEQLQHATQTEHDTIPLTDDLSKQFGEQYISELDVKHQACALLCEFICQFKDNIKDDLLANIENIFISQQCAPPAKEDSVFMAKYFTQFFAQHFSSRFNRSHNCKEQASKHHRHRKKSKRTELAKMTPTVYSKAAQIIFPVDERFEKIMESVDATHCTSNVTPLIVYHMPRKRSKRKSHSKPKLITAERMITLFQQHTEQLSEAMALRENVEFFRDAQASCIARIEQQQSELESNRQGIITALDKTSEEITALLRHYANIKRYTEQLKEIAVTINNDDYQPGTIQYTSLEQQLNHLDYHSVTDIYNKLLRYNSEKMTLDLESYTGSFTALGQLQSAVNNNSQQQLKLTSLENELSTLCGLVLQSGDAQLQKSCHQYFERVQQRIQTLKSSQQSINTTINTLVREFSPSNRKPRIEQGITNIITSDTFIDCCKIEYTGTHRHQFVDLNRQLQSLTQTLHCLLRGVQPELKKLSVNHLHELQQELQRILLLDNISAIAFDQFLPKLHHFYEVLQRINSQTQFIPAVTIGTFKYIGQVIEKLLNFINLVSDQRIIEIDNLQRQANNHKSFANLVAQFRKLPDTSCQSSIQGLVAAQSLASHAPVDENLGTVPEQYHAIKIGR